MLTAIQRQAVGFIPVNPSPFDNQDFCQAVNRTDSTQFQLASTELDGVEQVVNGSFDSPLASGTTTATTATKLVDAGATFFDDGIEPFMTIENKTDSTITDPTAIDSQTQLSLLSDIFTSGELYEISGWNYDSVWSTDAGTGTATKSAFGNSPFLQNIGVLDDQFYQVVVEISSLSALGIARVRLGGITQNDITKNGTFTFYVDFWRDTPLNDLIEVVADLAATTFVIESVSVKLLSSAGYRIKDLSGVVVDTNFDATNILHGAEVLPAQSNRIQVGVDWGVLANDCYQLCIIDTGQKNVVVNGRFNGNAAADWIVAVSSKWSFKEGRAIGDASGAASSIVLRRLQQVTALKGGKKYTLTYTILNFVGGTVTASTNDVTLSAQSANGTFTENIVLGQNISDFHSGYRAYTRKVLETIPYHNNSDGFVFDTELLTQAVYFGFKIGDVPVPVRYFDEASSINFSNSIIYGLKTLLTLAKYLIQSTKLWNYNLFSKSRGVTS